MGNVRLGGVRDPGALEVVADLGGVLQQFALYALLEQVAHIGVLGEGHMRTFVPDEAVAMVAVAMSTGVSVALEEDAVLVAQVVGATEAGETGAEDGDHDNALNLSEDRSRARRFSQRDSEWLAVDQHLSCL